MRKFNIMQNIRTLRRLQRIVDVMLKYELGFVVDKLKLIHLLPIRSRVNSEKLKEIKTKPVKIRKLFEDLGGTFIKLGQLLSLRPDMIPYEYCEELSKLQDQVPPFQSKDAVKIIEDELGKPLKELFLHFEEEPMASASIGQVYEAATKDGIKVAVKVQRPGIRKDIEADLDILNHLASLMKKHMDLSIIDPEEIVREFRRYTENELDYTQEATNAEVFYNNFKDQKDVKIPKVFRDLTTDKVLTLEFINGVKIIDLKKTRQKSVNRNEIATKIVHSVLKQVFEDGFFHADPHPGNIMLLNKERLAFIDFGIVGNFNSNLKRRATDLFVSMMNGDVEATTNAMLNLGVIPYEANASSLENDLREYLGKYYNSSLDSINMPKLFYEVINIAKKNGMKIPTDLVLLGKTIVTVQGLALELNPKFNLVKEAKPFIKEMIKKKTSPENIFKKLKQTTLELTNFVVELPKQTSELLRNVRDADRLVHLIDDNITALKNEVKRSTNRVSLGLLIAAFMIASALIYSAEQPTLFNLPAFSVIGFTITAILLIILFVLMMNENPR